jgi:hypothetical protein
MLTTEEWIEKLGKYFVMVKCHNHIHPQTGLVKYLVYVGKSRVWKEKEDCDPCKKQAIERLKEKQRNDKITRSWK